MTTALAWVLLVVLVAAVVAAAYGLALFLWDEARDGNPAAALLITVVAVAAVLGGLGWSVETLWPEALTWR